MHHPTGRVLSLLEIVQVRPGITGTELAEQLETDIRTVRRYITKLQDMGIPITGGRGRYGGYRLLPSYKLPPLIFNEEEAAAVVLGLLGSPWLNIDQSSAAVTAALSKILRVLPASAQERIGVLSSLMVVPPYVVEEAPNVQLITVCGEAIQNSRCLQIEYRSNENQTLRLVEPYGVVGRRGRWYLVGYCRLRRDFRTFRLDRVVSYRPINLPFSKEPRFDPLAYFETHVGQVIPGTPFRVWVDGDESLIRQKVAAGYGTLSSVEGRLLLTSATEDFDVAARYLMLLDIDFTVVDPPELREALSRLAQRAASASRKQAGLE